MIARRPTSSPVLPAARPPWLGLGTLIAACVMLSGLTAARAQEMIYIKKDTREATLAASLQANGVGVWPRTWDLIGPFDNAGGQGFDKRFPPETEFNASAEYLGKGGSTARWQTQDFPDGSVHSLEKFDTSDDCVCYLHRVVTAPHAMQVRCSLGSDDGIKVFLNGQEVYANAAVRPAAADQDFVTLNLEQGENHLLLKITNLGGQWAFFFRPTLPDRLLIALENRLEQDFPPQGEARYYRIETIPLPDNELIEVGGLAFRPDGKLVVGTRRGDLWLVENPLASADAVKMRPYVRGLHEVLGLTPQPNGDLYLVQRPEITLLKDTNGDDQPDEFITVNDAFGCSGDYHEYIFGPAQDRQGNLFVTLNVGFGGGHQSKTPYRGFCLKIAPNGEMTPWAFGLRSPNGVNFSPDGRLFHTDNQGEWVAVCKLQEIRQGEFYGHAASVRWWPGYQEGDLPHMTPPAVWFPYSMSKSASEPIWDTTGGKFGPFAGQCLVGDLTNSLLMRVDLEEVGGRMQGACFHFRGGFRSGVNRLAFASDGTLFVGQTNRGWGSVGGRTDGLQRVVFTGEIPFEIQTMRLTSAGWRLTFTQPVDPSTVQPGSFSVQSYTYHHWNTYGSPEIERSGNNVQTVQVEDGGLSATVEIADLRPGRVYHLRADGLKNQSGEPLLHADAFYTANQLQNANAD